MARTRSKIVATETEVAALPSMVKAADKAYPKNPKTRVEYLELYYSRRFGWCVATLPINQRTGRTYGATMEGGIVTMGGNGDRDQRVTLYIHEGNSKRLEKLIALKNAGKDTAGDIRDRIGSRRAEGQVRRSLGQTSWMWSK